MDKVSIIIPARGEKIENLERTLRSIYSNATGDFEVIIGFNGKTTREHLNLVENYPYSQYIEFPENVGIKNNINTLATLATGKYLLKLDAHCSVSKGFDVELQKDMQEDWIVTPRFKIIKDDWSIQQRDGQEEFYDYFYLSCPFTDKKGLRFKAGGHWGERTKERNPTIDHILGTRLPTTIDETPQIHGSCWFMTKDRFFEMGGFPLQDPYGHGQEPLWLALKNWLMDGKVMVNKNVWYAHLHQDSKDRGYPENREETERTYNLTAKYFLNNEGHFKHDFAWFIEKFWPMPSWPEDWEEIYGEWLVNTIGAKNG